MVNRRRHVFALALGAVLAIASAATVQLVPPSSAHADNDNTPWLQPTRPPQCSSAAVVAGTVAGCLVGNNFGPEKNDWPIPPFPSDPAGSSPVGIVPLAGWAYSGLGYNGSPALSAWEAQMASNDTAIGSVRAGQLTALPDALPLFEGFLADIQAGGYRVNDAGTYSFRCVSSSTRNCQGLERNSLSNHSWGLAIDMNSGTNASTTYVGINGASACATPINTDMPRWVVQTAEKWGLYWGGYGWNNGCDSPSQVRSSVVRDIPHFEFRGTPTQARAIALANLGGRCLDVADEAGTVTERCLLSTETPAAEWRVVVDTKAPAGATAALVNLTLTGATNAGFATAEPCSARTGARTSSNGNAMPGQTVANLAVVALDAAGRFCLYRSQAMHSVVDVQGFFAPASAAGPSGTLYNPVTPARVLDTRAQSHCSPGGTCAERGPVASGGEVVVDTPMAPAGAVSMLANLTVTEAAGSGYLTADSCPALVPGPQSHSNANFLAGDTVANLGVVPLSAGTSGQQFCTYATAPVQNVIDVQGYFAPPTSTGWGLTTVPTQRLVDTRTCWTDAVVTTQRCGLANPAGSVIHLRAPAGASAVLINLTLTDAALPGFATAQACSQLTGAPRQSNSNVVPGKVAANLAVVAVDPDGTFCITVSAAMHVVVDLQGTFAAGSGLQFVPTAPTRRSDTRFLAA